MRFKAVWFLLVQLLIVGTARANTVTFNFGSLSQPGTGNVFVGNSFAKSGFTLTSGSNDFYIWQSGSANLPGLNSANTSLFEFFAGSTTTLTRGGGTFSVNSIDLAPLLAGGNGAFTATFTGTRANSSTVSLSVTVLDSPSPLHLTTFNFGGLTNLVSFSFTQGFNIGFFGSQGTAYQFDNLVVTPSTIPEPGTVILLGTGLLGLFLKRKSA